MDQYRLTKKELAGQRLMFGFDGIDFNEELRYLIGKLKACGIILFKRNIERPEQVKSLCENAQKYAVQCGLPPLFIAVDQEGGTVARCREGFTAFPGNPYIKTLDEASHFARITADELLEVGINMNYAPVLDVVPDNVDSIMKERSFQGGPDIVAGLGSCVIHHLQKRKVMAVAKHFPGIGRTVKDSHFHLPVLDVDYATLKETDMIPFAEAVKKDVSGIMLSHIFYPQLDPEFQASLSPKIVQSVLRKDLEYDGLIITDDLDMKAIKEDIKTCIYQICKARVDIALICHKGPNIELAFNEMETLLRENDLFWKMGKVCVERILKYKQKYLRPY
jgi:beta-N-acetylhexosaminidase